MKISLAEFDPFIEPIEISGEVIETSRFNLRMENWAEKNYESLVDYIEKVKAGDASSIYVGFYMLIKNKKWGYKDFLEKVAFKDRSKMPEIAKTISEHLAYVITAAQPVIKNPNRIKEINEAFVSEENEEANNYAIIFDKVARRYGYTVDQFYDLTSRQLHAALKAADIEDYKDLETRAALAGKKLKERLKFHDFSPEEEKAHEEQALDAVERLKRRAEERNGRK